MDSDSSQRLVYTSDFMRIDEEPQLLCEPDVLVMQTHWFNEPHFNRPFHMSFQAAMDYIRRWKPKTATYLVHMSDGDLVEGDPCNNSLKKIAPASPLKPPGSETPYSVPKCQREWQDTVERVCNDHGIPGEIVVAYDGLTIKHSG
jgi:phosphoribosyl 1,2-cyclic phosphate phosphodiesterase